MTAPRLDPVLAAVVREVDGPTKAVIVTDESGVILWWSEGAAELYGWQRDEVVGRHVVGVTPTSLSMGEAARIMSRLQSGVPWKGEFAVRTKQGEELVVDVLDVPVKRENGSLIGIIGVSRPSSR
jgi:PAS domain S-box-containing protein